jgi:hypothetical protein
VSGRLFHRCDVVRVVADRPRQRQPTAHPIRLGDVAQAVRQLADGLFVLAQLEARAVRHVAGTSRELDDRHDRVAGHEARGRDLDAGGKVIDRVGECRSGRLVVQDRAGEVEHEDDVRGCVRGGRAYCLGRHAGRKEGGEQNDAQRSSGAPQNVHP